MLIDLVEPRPALPPAKAWDDLSDEEQCLFAGYFYSTWCNATTVSSIRLFGHDRTYEAFRKLLRLHQENSFLTGVQRLGLDAESSDAVRCAKYHCLSNLVGGYQVVYGIESDSKAWMFYLPTSCDIPYPGPGEAIHTEDAYLADYLGWHSNNGELLGNPGLVFVATHFVANGDPVDGGYFLDTGTYVPPEDRTRVAPDEEPGSDVVFTAEGLDPGDWPPERLAKACRNYGVGWARDWIVSMLAEFGEEGKVPISRALCLVAYQWLPRLLTAFAPRDADLDPLDRFASVFAGLHQAGRISHEVERSGDEVLIRLQPGVLGDADADPDVARLSGEALLDAWGRIARAFDRTTQLVTTDDQWEWILRRQPISGRAAT